MSKTAVRHETHQTERERVVHFRYQWLRRTGFTVENATEISERVDIDWHKAVDIFQACTKKGYDQEFVMELLR